MSEDKSQEKLANRISAIKEVKEVKWPSSDTGGVLPMNMASRFADERHRLGEDYTEKWRQYRIKYLKSLILERKEPRDVPELTKLLVNPIRRAFHIPLNYYEKLVMPYMGRHYSRQSRNGIAIALSSYAVTLFLYYTLHYSENTNNWETFGKLTVFSQRPEVLPGDPAYPMPNPKPYDWQFNDKQFSKRKSHLDL